MLQLDETVAEVAKETFVEMEETIFRDRQNLQFHEVSTFASRIIEVASLRLLSRTIATNAESILVRQYMERLSSAMLVKAMIGKLRRVHKQERSLVSNAAMRHLHQQVTARVAISRLLEMLPHQLKRDEMDIDARENMDGFSLDEEEAKTTIALRMQASFRGKKDRMRYKQLRMEMESNAAAKIQASFRGNNTRRKLKQEESLQQQLYGV